MDQSEAAGIIPLTTMEIDCAVSAKGDINVSWRVKAQIPSSLFRGEHNADDTATHFGNLTWNLSNKAQVIAARAKRDYAKALAAGDALDDEAIVGAIYETDQSVKPYPPNDRVVE